MTKGWQILPLLMTLFLSSLLHSPVLSSILAYSWLEVRHDGARTLSLCLSFLLVLFSPFRLGILRDTIPFVFSLFILPRQTNSFLLLLILCNMITSVILCHFITCVVKRKGGDGDDDVWQGFIYYKQMPHQHNPWFVPSAFFHLVPSATILRSSTSLHPIHLSSDGIFVKTRQQAPSYEHPMEQQRPYLAGCCLSPSR